jgi:hypothetical protein
MSDALDRVVVMGDDCPLLVDAKVDPTTGPGLVGHAGRLSDDCGDRHIQPTPMLGEGDRQDPRPALSEQALQAPRVFLGLEPTDHRYENVAPVGLQAHRAGAEADSAEVTAAGLEAGEPDPPAVLAAMLGLRPVVQRRDQIGDAAGVGLFGAFPPPRRTCFLAWFQSWQMVGRFHASAGTVGSAARASRLAFTRASAQLWTNRRAPKCWAIAERWCGVVGSTSKRHPGATQPSGIVNRRSPTVSAFLVAAGGTGTGQLLGAGDGAPGTVAGATTAREPSAEASEQVHHVPIRSSVVSPGSVTTNLRPYGSRQYLNRSRMHTSNLVPATR